MRHINPVEEARLATLKRRRVGVILSLVFSELFLIGTDFAASNWPRLFTTRGNVFLFFSHLFAWVFIIIMAGWAWIVEREIVAHGFLR